MFPEVISTARDNVFSGEREIGTSLKDFSSDHLNRYRFARYFIKRHDIVLDAACGVGYGSYVLAEKSLMVDAIDYNCDAIRYAEEHWARSNIRYICGDLLDIGTYPSGQKYRVIVSFETIEHLKDDARFLAFLSDRLQVNGLLFVSSPNANLLDAKKNPWHERHYTPEEFRTFLSAYFRYISEFTQISCGIRKGKGGDNNILVCSNRPLMKIRLGVFTIHTFLYRLKMRLLQRREIS